MSRPVTKLGKVGNTVWGKNPHGQTCYALVVPANPRTAPQQANRGGFGATGQDWGGLTDEERTLWKADARNYRTHGRPGSRRATLTGFQRYMSVNARRAHQGLPPLRVPPVAANPPPVALPLRPLAFSLQPLALSPTPRVPMRHRSATVATRLQHALTPLDPPCSPVHARAGPGPPFLPSFRPKFLCPKPPARQ